MALLSFTNLGQSYGDFDVFAGASGSIANDTKIGIVGPNGIGKTTLLRILAGFESAAGGQIHRARDLQIGYLRQEAVRAFAGRKNSVWHEMLSVFSELRAREKRLRTLELQMAAGNFDDELFEQYSALQQQFELDGGYDYEVRIKHVLLGLGFEPDDFALPISYLSGGQKTRALLARLLLEQPSLLILDEPTNHLDIQAVEWLEGAIKLWPGAVVIVSHDRYFLDKAVDYIWELSRSGIEHYRGNYSHYLQQRDERWSLRQAEYEQMTARFFKELDFIKRNIARDSTKDQAVGRLKRLVREVRMMQAGGSSALTDMQWAVAAERYDISGAKWGVADVEQAIKRLPRPSGRWHEMKLNLKVERRSGNIVMRSKDLVIGYDDQPLFRADDIELHRLERAALIGPNGAGKTSFLKTLLDRIEPLAGRLDLGASLDVGYFAQAHDELDPSRSVLQELMERSGLLVAEARNVLGRFLFQGDDVFKPIQLLSGGERGRLALALLQYQKANFLLLDEPTNHLDIPAQEVLQQALEDFDGTLLMVSHDRYLIDRMATQIWELRDGCLYVYRMSYADYLLQRQAEKAEEKAQAQISPPPIVDEDQSDSQRSKNEQMRLEQTLAQLESDITEQERRLLQSADLLQQASQNGDGAQIQQASADYAAAERKLEKLMAHWEQLAHTL